MGQYLGLESQQIWLLSILFVLLWDKLLSSWSENSSKAVSGTRLAFLDSFVGWLSCPCCTSWGSGTVQRGSPCLLWSSEGVKIMTIYFVFVLMNF